MSTKKPKKISVKGAALHNLKNVSIELPHNALTVISGLSGSGKSSLAFDTIYAEGQRRFTESLSAYARQFLERMGKPDVDKITGIPPAIAIEQKPPSRNPRSTVGTSTEIYDYLRLLFGRIGRTFCYKCGREVKKDTPDSVTDEILKWDDDDKIYIMFPFPPETESLAEEMEKYRKAGFFRIVKKNTDELIDTETTKINGKHKLRNYYVLADRLKIQKGPDMRSRLAESMETAFRASGGRVYVRNLNTGKTVKFSKKFECLDCDIIYFEPEPRLFSFNNPYGACPTCQGFGRSIGIDEDLVIPDKSKSIKAGAIQPFKSQGFAKHLRALIRHAPDHNIPLEVPYRTLTEEQRNKVWRGFGNYVGINGFFKILEEKSYKLHYRVLVSRYRGYTTCPSCGGSRLRTSARQVFVGGKNIPEIIKMPLNKLLDYIESLDLSKHDLHIAGQVIREIHWRLGLLIDIGLEYLTLGRLTHTLSGGEAQRINLSTALGSSLVGTLYVLDEPSIGMHPRDTKRLMNILFKLRNLGNTVIVVEHDPEIISEADYLVDMGPGAGEHGGEVVFAGPLGELKDCRDSITSQYLYGRKTIEIPDKKNDGNGQCITIHKPQRHNLDIKQVSFPLGCMNVVTGVSGSGKSTLVHDILYNALKKHLALKDNVSGPYEKIEGLFHINYVELVDQSPIGRSSRSTPATYTKAFDAIRELFASTQAAKQMGYKPGYFSFNVPGGRCEVCEGEGSVSVDMQFLPDVHLECEACKGTRYKRETQEILFRDKSIVDVLNMTISEALQFFENEKKIARKLKVLEDTGLGYLRLGQPSTMLSGGESQRVKLANHLIDKRKGQTVFIFDEPTTGLHMDDISRLMACFRSLVDAGNTVIIIEHNLHVIASADWIIDLGPGAGDKGGKLVAEGTPKMIAIRDTPTGNAIGKFLKNGKMF